MAQATVIGLPDWFSIPVLLEIPRDANWRSLFGITSIYRCLDELGSSGELECVTSAPSFFHYELLGHLPELIRGRDVVLVTCHGDLGPAVADAFSAASVRVEAVPLQGSLRSRFDAAGDAATGHYPGRYRDLLHDLRNVQPGELVLVAAGILAEVYCDVARQAGAVAVDVGSAVDIWAGAHTRTWGQTDDLYAAHRLV